MGKAAAFGAGALILIVVLLGAAAAGVSSLFSFGSGSGAAPSSDALADIPAAYLLLDMRAAASCPGLPWSVLAGIGKVETDFARIPDMVSPDGAVGPMQFLPATFAQYANPVPPGGASPATPWDPADAVYAAARMLCAGGARNNTHLYQAIYSYNHADWYVAEVLSYAQKYAAASGEGAAGTAAGGSASATAIDYAHGQLGIPYQWAGDGPGVNGSIGFDCSGLTQAAYQAAGIALPRTAQAQYDATAKIPAGAALAPGDLVFYGTSATAITHVGLYIGNGLMIDAPHTGAVVRIEAYTWSDYIGATRPAS